MVSERTKTIVGYALLGLGIGLIVFSLFYVVTVRTGIAQRFTWTWVAIHLAVLLLPGVVLALYGASRKPTMPT